METPWEEVSERNTNGFPEAASSKGGRQAVRAEPRSTRPGFRCAARPEVGRINRRGAPQGGRLRSRPRQRQPRPVPFSTEDSAAQGGRGGEALPSPRRRGEAPSLLRRGIGDLLHLHRRERQLETGQPGDRLQNFAQARPQRRALLRDSAGALVHVRGRPLLRRRLREFRGLRLHQRGHVPGDRDLPGDYLLRRAAGRGGGPRQRVGAGDGAAGDGERPDRRPPGPLRDRGTLPADAGRRRALHAAHDLHVEGGDVQEEARGLLQALGQTVRLHQPEDKIQPQPLVCPLVLGGGDGGDFGLSRRSA